MSKNTPQVPVTRTLSVFTAQDGSQRNVSVMHRYDTNKVCCGYHVEFYDDLELIAIYEPGLDCSIGDITDTFLCENRLPETSNRINKYENRN